MIKRAPYSFINPLDLTDCYKIFHYQMYPKNMTYLYSNFTPRSNKHMNLPRLNDGFDDHVVNFGLQGFIKQHLIETWNNGFFKQNAHEIITDYTTKIQKRYSKSLLKEHIENLYALHELQYLPIQICGIPEGMVVPIGIPLMTCESTDERFAWLVNYLETIDCSQLWKPLTSATTAFWYRRVFNKFSKLTGGNPDMIEYLGHDFSFRGMSGVYDAAVSGAAHLLCFTGTDNIPGVDYIEEYYNDCRLYFENIAPPAGEHSVMCAGTEKGELDTIKRLITEVFPTGIVSIPADTWDYWNTITNYTSQLKDIIMNRDGKTVWRPDSGTPIDIICGTLQCPIYYFDNNEELHNLIAYWVYGSSFYVRSDEDVCDRIIEILRPDIVNDLTRYANIKNITVRELLPHPNSKYKFVFINNDKFVETTLRITFLSEPSSPADLSNSNCMHMTIEYIDIKNIEDSAIDAVSRGSLDVLWNIFGGTVNSSGYKMLDSHVGLIYGDSITPNRILPILETMTRLGYCCDNVVYGIGSYTYNYVTRDTYGTAMKATLCVIAGEERAIYKNPTGDSTKHSTKGYLYVNFNVVNDKQEITLTDDVSKIVKESKFNLLQPVFLNGKIVRETTIDQMRDNIKRELVKL